MLGKCQTALRFAGDLLTGRQRKTHSTVHTKWYVSSTLLGKRAVKFLESANSQNVKFCYWNSLIFHLFGTFCMQKSAIFLNSIWTPNHTVSQIWKKTAFSFWVEILGENMLEEPSNTFVSFLVKNEGNIFFHFLPYKTCKLGATGHGPRGLAGMKIMKIILCYCAQWCCSSWF